MAARRGGGAGGRAAVSHPNLVESTADIAEIARTCRVVAVVGMKDETRSWEPAYAIPKMLVDRGIEVIPATAQRCRRHPVERGRLMQCDVRVGVVPVTTR